MSSSANFKTKIKNYLTIAIKDQNELQKTLKELEENPEAIIKKMLRTRLVVCILWIARALQN